MDIKKGAKIPEKGGGVASKYPFSEMKKGDSFEIDCDSMTEAEKTRVSVLSSANQRGFKITTRRVNSKVTVWLTGEN